MTSNDLLSPVTATGAAALIYLLFEAIDYCIKQKSKKKRVAIKKNAPKKLTIYGFLPIYDPSNDKSSHLAADCSPFCLKLATYLRICGVDHDYKYATDADYDMNNAPKGKVPFAHWERLNSGELMGDSTLIMKALVDVDPHTFDIDKHLTAEERAIGVAIKTMLQESTYWSIINVRWLTNAQFKQTTGPKYMAKLVPLPSFLKTMMINSIRGKITKDARSQGIGLLNESERTIKYQTELKALSDFLGDKTYIMGDKVSSFDATVYAWVECMTKGWEHDMFDSAREYKNLMGYASRMKGEFFGVQNGIVRSR